jgi:hypothetical protein
MGDLHKEYMKAHNDNPDIHSEIDEKGIAAAMEKVRKNKAFSLATTLTSDMSTREIEQMVSSRLKFGEGAEVALAGVNMNDKLLVLRTLLTHDIIASEDSSSINRGIYCTVCNKIVCT